MNARDVRVTSVYDIYEWEEVKKILVERTLDRLEPSEAAERLRAVPLKDVEVKVLQQSEGSPAYTVSKWRIHVNIVSSSDI